MNEIDWAFIRLVVICVAGLASVLLMERHDSRWWFERERAGVRRRRLVLVCLLEGVCSVAGIWQWAVLWEAKFGGQ